MSCRASQSSRARVAGQLDDSAKAKPPEACHGLLVGAGYNDELVLGRSARPLRRRILIVVSVLGMPPEPFPGPSCPIEVQQMPVLLGVAPVRPGRTSLIVGHDLQPVVRVRPCYFTVRICEEQRSVTGSRPFPR